MNRTSRYLLFYVILGIGLALSWTQVGKRAQLGADANMSIMELDDDCRPQIAPCAAYARDFALVLGPDEGGLKLLAERLPVDARLEFMQLQAGGAELDPPLVQRVDGQGWRLKPGKGAERLRISVVQGDKQWVAEYLMP